MLAGSFFGVAEGGESLIFLIVGHDQSVAGHFRIDAGAFERIFGFDQFGRVERAIDDGDGFAAGGVSPPEDRGHDHDRDERAGQHALGSGQAGELFLNFCKLRFENVHRLPSLAG